MSRNRYAVIVNDKALSTTATSGTETIDLPERGILLNLTILWRHNMTYTDNTMLPIHYALKKIEVLVNGSTVVKSVTGSQIRALMWYNGGPFGQLNDYDQGGGGNKTYHQFTLYFSRSNVDDLFGLDLSQYANPQLRITWDAAVTSHDGVTYDVGTTPAVVFNVMAKIMESAPADFSGKYIQTREISSWTFAASTERNTEIPRGRSLRGIMLRAGYNNNGYFDFWEKVKLDFDNGAYMPLDMDYENLLRLHLDAWPNPVIMARYWFAADGDNFNSDMYYVCGSGWSGSRANISSAKVPIIYWPISTVDLKDSSGAALTGGGAQTMVSVGWGPMQTFYIPMRSLLSGNEESIDTTLFGRIDLKTTSGSGVNTSAKGAVVAEYEIPNGS